MANITRKYYETLGRFVHDFAQVEAFMQIVLWAYAGTPIKIAQSIFSGTRTDQAISFIRRIRDALGMAQDENLKDVFSQIGYINAARNTLIHYGAQPINNSGDLMSTNAFVAHHERTLKQYPVSVRMLDNMNFDIHVVNAKLMMHLMEHKGITPTAENLADVRKWSQQPWRYKPPGQANNHQKSRGKNPKRPRQPKSSPA